MTNLDSILKSRDITLPTKVRLVKAMVFPMVMYGCESWTIKKGWEPKQHFEMWCWRSLESPGDSKQIKAVRPKGNQSSIFIGRTDAEAEAPTLWPPDVKSWHIVEAPDAGKGWRQAEKGTTKDEMVGWHHQLNGHEFEQARGVNEAQGRLACYSPWGRKESDMTATYLSCCKQCCSEHWGADILSYHVFLWIYAQKWDFWVPWQLCF